MADDPFLFAKDFLKSPKKSPLVFRLLLLVFVMICGVYLCSVCLKQVSFDTNAECFGIRLKPEPCPMPDIEPWEVPYVHYPRPRTFSREECRCNPVRFFAIISMQRSGSGWFETLLNNHTNISSNGEMLGAKIRRTNISSLVANLDKVYNLDFWSSSAKNECTAAVGFKWMLNQGVMLHHKEVIKYFNTRGVSAIFLFRRNLLGRLISVLANSYDKETRLLNGTHKSHVHSHKEAEVLASYKPVINTTTLYRNLSQVEGTTRKALDYFKSTRHIILYYEDVVKNRTKLEEVQEFLRVPRMELQSRQVKIHKGSLSSHVKNWIDVQKALKGTKYESFLLNDDRK